MLEHLYDKRERLAEDVRQYVRDNVETTGLSGEYMELSDEVYFDPWRNDLIDAGSVEISTDGRAEETAVNYLEQEEKVTRYQLRNRLRDENHMDIDVTGALLALEEKENVIYRDDVYEVDTRPERASDGQVIRLLEEEQSLDKLLES